MYFVVYLKKLEKNVILPASWIKDVDDHLKKFINKSLNSVQLFRCYYTSSRRAFDAEMRPDSDFVPEFTLNVVSEPIGHNFDGCFFGKLKQFFGKLVLYT